MNAVKTASVKMRWDTFTFPVRVGTPVSEHGVLANDANAFGLVMRTVNAEPDANEWLQVMTDGIVDMEEIIAGYGTELTTAAMTAMSGIHVFSGGKRVNVSEESEEIATLRTQLATLGTQLAKWILAESTDRFRVASGENDCNIRFLDDDDSYIMVTFNSYGLSVTKTAANGTTTMIASIHVYFTYAEANGTSTVNFTIPNIVDLSPSNRKIIGICNGGSNNGKSVLSVVPQSATSVDVTFSGNVSASGAIFMTFLF